MLATIVIGAIIGLYAGWVIFKKYKDWKAGKYCSCGCSGCSGKKSCAISSDDSVISSEA